MKVVEFFLMSGMGKSVSRWGVHVGMSSLLVLSSVWKLTDCEEVRCE